MDKSWQREESPYAVWIWGLVIFIVLCWIGFCITSKDAGSGGKNAAPRSVTRAKPAAVPVWHRAESKKEVVHRIQTRLLGELVAHGLDASNIVANAKAHPTRLRARVPEHERSRWLVLSTNDEAVIARRYVEECEKKGRFDDRPESIARVRGIMERLVAVVPEIDALPEIHILRDDSVNACCLPNGTVFVNDGTLKAISDDLLLAAILAHELGHAAARHGNEDLTLALIGAAAGVAFEEWVSGIAPILDSVEGVSIVRIAYGLGGAVGFYLPRNRNQEAESDRLGTRYLARAGFDPEAMVRLFEYFEAIAPQTPDIFTKILSTHPLHADRIAHIREVLAEPDLREMPKEGWGAKLKKKADEIDFTAIKPEDLGKITNAVPHIPTNITIALPIPTNLAEKAKGGVGILTNIWNKHPKLPFGRKKDGESEPAK